MRIPLYADFHNADERGRVRLNVAGTFKDLERAGIALAPGISLLLYDEETEVEGSAEYSDETGIWVAVVNWNDFRPRSGSTWCPV